MLVGGHDLARRVGKLDHRLPVALGHLDHDVDRVGAGVVSAERWCILLNFLNESTGPALPNYKLTNFWKGIMIYEANF